MDALQTLESRGFIQQCTNLERVRGLLSEERVTFYVGFDPTADSLHVGSLVPIMAMAWLQRMGHRVIAIVGGGTARVGDPSGKTELRKLLSGEAIAANSVCLREQLSRYLTLDGEQGILVDNADWLCELSYIDFLREIGSMFSVNRMLSAEAYRQRLERGLSFIEFNYQILQAYDFLELYRRYDCTLQVGGDDQWGNMLAGTDLIRRCEQAEAHALTLPLITTATGAKMGKTAQGAVWLSDTKLPVFDFFQYWLNVDDRDVGRFLKMYTFLELEEIERLEALEGADIREAKRVLAMETTTLCHGREAAEKAAAGAVAMVGSSAEADLPTLVLEADTGLLEVMKQAGFAKSNGEARRLVQGGAVRIDGEQVTDGVHEVQQASLGDGVVLRVGKKRAVRLLPA